MADLALWACTINLNDFLLLYLLVYSLGYSPVLEQYKVLQAEALLPICNVNFSAASNSWLSSDELRDVSQGLKAVIRRAVQKAAIRASQLREVLKDPNVDRVAAAALPAGYALFDCRKVF